MTHREYLDTKWRIAILRLRNGDTAELERRIADYEAERRDLPDDFAEWVKG